MKRTLPFLLAVLALPLGPGCGDFSNEDLLFLAALPKRQEISVDVAQTGTPAGALIVANAVGQKAEYYEQAHAIATGINTGVGELLDFVDGLGRGHPPTEREANRRVWGPVADVDGSGLTLRLEINRRRDGDGAPTYSFCLQIGRDEDFTGESASCDPEGSAGLTHLLWGTYQPGRADGLARSGSGELHVDFDASQRLGTAKGDEKGLLDISYDFSDGGAAKSVGMDWAWVDLGTFQAQALAYAYARTQAGAVDFHFEFTADIIGGGWQNPLSLLRETAAIDASWQEDGPGRAAGHIYGGDVPGSDEVLAVECWDAQQARTYYALTVGFDPTQNQEEGDLGACPAP